MSSWCCVDFGPLARYIQHESYRYYTALRTSSGWDCEEYIDQDQDQTPWASLGLGRTKKMDPKSLVRVKHQMIPNSMPNMHEKFAVGKVLGEGAYGVVSLVEDRESGKLYACKTMGKSKMTREDAEWVRKEVEIMASCSDHENVVEYVCAYEDDRNVNLILGLCSGGELFDRIIAKGFYSEKDACDLFRTMLKTVAYLHQKSVMHRDLKPENFLLDGPGDDAKLVLTDFGVSDYFTPGQFMSEKLGSPTYVAPEVIMGRYNEKCDTWSLGVILYVLLSGRTPFFGKNEREEFQRARKGIFSMEKDPWPKISPEAKALIKRMLTPDYNKRPSAAECLQDPWIADRSIAKDINLADSVFGGMRRFSEMSKLKKRAIQIMSKNLKEDDVAHLKEIFNAIDSDHSGSVSPDELKRAMIQAGTSVSEEELGRIIDSYDVDGDGQIDLSEFISALLDLSKLNTMENIRRAFAELDTDNSGTISAKEVLDALQDVAGMDLEKAKEVVREADTNGNGEIEWEEFYEMMIKHDEMMQRAHTRQRKKTIGVTVSSNDAYLSD